MSTELLQVRDGDGAVAVALSLAHSRHVHVRSEDCLLLEAGFMPGVCAVDLWTSTSVRRPAKIEGELADWVASGVRFELCDVASLGTERLVDEVYFPLLVPFAYCAGKSDFPLNLEAFRRLLAPDVVLAMAYQQDRVIAATLAQPAVRTPSMLYSDTELVKTGLDVVATAVLPGVSTASFLFAGLDMFSTLGVTALRSRRNPWVTTRNASSWCLELRHAERIAWERREPRDSFFWQPAMLDLEEGLLTFESVAGALRIHRIGRMTRDLMEARRMLEALVESAESGAGTRDVG